MLRRRFLAALGLAPAALIPAAKAAEHTGPLVRGVKINGYINCAGMRNVRFENCFVDCSGVSTPGNAFVIEALPDQA